MNTIADLLIEQYEFDIGVMSQPWMYWCVMVPIILYAVFFLVKWTVLTAPAWLPLAYVFGAIKVRITK